MAELDVAFETDNHDAEVMPTAAERSQPSAAVERLKLEEIPGNQRE